MDFLNVLLRDRENIKTLTYLKNEHLGNTQEDRKAVFDLYCENESGEKFIIELQKVEQDFFKDRNIYYSNFALNALDTSYKKGEEKGIEKGKREEKFEIALQMLKDGKSIEK
ncbi:MAG: PD-(D/E)XK nuclease family transposase [Thermonemataceae bacterium]|nr:PD-(D/E)XK nuclease family transposase [Thermonemataceae bacterium]